MRDRSGLGGRRRDTGGQETGERQEEGDAQPRLGGNPPRIAETILGPCLNCLESDPNADGDFES